MTCLLGSLPVTPISLCLLLLLLLIIIIIIIILHSLWWIPTRIQKLLALQGIKGPPFRLIHGNTKQISTMIKEAMPNKDLSHHIFPIAQPHIHSWTKIYGKNYLQWHGSRAQLVITQPELCKDILNNKDRAYPKRETMKFVKKVLGDGLVTTIQDEKWAKLRKIATHAFHGDSLKSMFPAMVASTETMLKRWENFRDKEVEVFEEFRLLTSEVISRTAFGSSYIEGKDIFEKLMKLGFLIFKNTLATKLPLVSKVYKTRDEMEADEVEKGVHASIMEIVKKRERKAITGGGKGRFGTDFLGLLLNAHHDIDDGNHNQKILADELIDECKTFYFSAQETTNTFLTWTVFLLAHHTHWQEQARKEVLQLFGKQTPNLDGISKLKTMTMIFNESMRLYSPVVHVIRKAKREVRLGNVILPQNVELLVSNLALHHDPQIWGEDAQLFKPDRFGEGVAKATNNNVGAFVPFGLGPRSCVGLNFATTEAKIALLMILQRYSFTLSPGYVHFPIHYVTLRPKHGVQVVLRSLSSSN